MSSQAPNNWADSGWNQNGWNSGGGWNQSPNHGGHVVQHPQSIAVLETTPPGSNVHSNVVSADERGAANHNQIHRHRVSEPPGYRGGYQQQQIPRFEEYAQTPPGPPPMLDHGNVTPPPTLGHHGAGQSNTYASRYSYSVSEREHVKTVQPPGPPPILVTPNSHSNPQQIAQTALGATPDLPPGPPPYPPNYPPNLAYEGQSGVPSSSAGPYSSPAPSSSSSGGTLAHAVSFDATAKDQADSKEPAKPRTSVSGAEPNRDEKTLNHQRKTNSGGIFYKDACKSWWLESAQENPQNPHSGPTPAGRIVQNMPEITEDDQVTKEEEKLGFFFDDLKNKRSVYRLLQRGLYWQANNPEKWPADFTPASSESPGGPALPDCPAFEGQLMLLDPFEMKFSQMVVYPRFSGGEEYAKPEEMPPVQINKEAAEEIITRARCDEADVGFAPVTDEGVPESMGSAEGQGGTPTTSPNKNQGRFDREYGLLTHKFPVIRVIRHRPKQRDMRGRPKEDPVTKETLYGTEQWFTLDNRRLLCLQRAACLYRRISKHPKLLCLVCNVGVEVDLGPEMQVPILDYFSNTPGEEGAGTITNNPNRLNLKAIATAKSMHAGYHSAHSASISKEITKFRTRTNGNTVEIGLYKGRGRDNVKRADCMENFFWEPHQADHWTQHCFTKIMQGILTKFLMEMSPTAAETLPGGTAAPPTRDVMERRLNGMKVDAQRKIEARVEQAMRENKGLYERFRLACQRWSYDEEEWQALRRCVILDCGVWEYRTLVKEWIKQDKGKGKDGGKQKKFELVMQTFGPFSETQMTSWERAGALPLNLQVRRRQGIIVGAATSPDGHNHGPAPMAPEDIPLSAKKDGFFAKPAEFFLHTSVPYTNELLRECDAEALEKAYKKSVYGGGNSPGEDSNGENAFDDRGPRGNGGSLGRDRGNTGVSGRDRGDSNYHYGGNGKKDNRGRGKGGGKTRGSGASSGSRGPGRKASSRGRGKGNYDNHYKGGSSRKDSSYNFRGRSDSRVYGGKGGKDYASPRSGKDYGGKDYGGKDYNPRTPKGGKDHSTTPRGSNNSNWQNNDWGGQGWQPNNDNGWNGGGGWNSGGGARNYDAYGGRADSRGSRRGYSRDSRKGSRKGSRPPSRPHSQKGSKDNYSQRDGSKNNGSPRYSSRDRYYNNGRYESRGRYDSYGGPGGYNDRYYDHNDRGYYNDNRGRSRGTSGGRPNSQRGYSRGRGDSRGDYGRHDSRANSRKGGESPKGGKGHQSPQKGKGGYEKGYGQGYDNSKGNSGSTPQGRSSYEAFNSPSNSPMHKDGGYKDGAKGGNDKAGRAKQDGGRGQKSHKGQNDKRAKDGRGGKEGGKDGRRGSAAQRAFREQVKEAHETDVNDKGGKGGNRARTDSTKGGENFEKKGGDKKGRKSDAGRNSGASGRPMNRGSGEYEVFSGGKELKEGENATGDKSDKKNDNRKTSSTSSGNTTNNNGQKQNRKESTPANGNGKDAKKRDSRDSKSKADSAGASGGGNGGGNAEKKRSSKSSNDGTNGSKSKGKDGDKASKDAGDKKKTGGHGDKNGDKRDSGNSNGGDKKKKKDGKKDSGGDWNDWAGDWDWNGWNEQKTKK